MTIHYRYYIGLAFTLNYMIGSGFLAIPWAVRKCGLCLSTIILIFISYLCFISSILVLQTIYRAELIIKYENNQNLNPANNYNSISNSNIHNNSTYTTKSAIEYGDLCRMFLGDTGHLIYTLFISIYIYGTLWAYITIFANAMAIHFPIGIYSYFYYIIIFMMIVFPLTCIELSNQITLQVLLTFGRITFVILMLGTILYKCIIDENINNNNIKITYFNLSGIHHMLAIALCAMIFHHSIPNLRTLMHPYLNNQQIIQVFHHSLTISLIIYILLGICLSIYFQSNIKTSANLNWIIFINNDTESHFSSRNILRYISSFIILFPAINVISSFSLNAITLGINTNLFYYINIMIK